MTVAELPAGLTDRVVGAQQTFSTVMEAMARPGSVQRVSASVGVPWRLMRGSALIALTLFDHDTPVWLDEALSESAEVASWLRFHCGAPVVTEPSRCSFALVSDVLLLPGLDRFCLGTTEYPDRSTTLIIQVDSLLCGVDYRLRGPGIEGMTTFCASVRLKGLFERLAMNEALFPRGIDVVLVEDDLVAAIPRTTRFGD
ncbi:MAG: phosphonate C-P lyase system protein PhnH [Alphaproteobacteria bacterium]|nr:phosphonate C-P lyase system protein PhnH [Alphaproteobacteria bacterium]